MSQQQKEYEDQIRAIAAAFYTLKGETRRPGFGPRAKNWVYFERIRNFLAHANILNMWKTFMVAQFHYSYDRKKLWPSMCANASAFQKYEWYLEKKIRRVGKTRPEQIEAEPDLDDSRIESVFRQSAWWLEAYLRRGLEPVEIFKMFPIRFHYLFILADKDVWFDMQRSTGGYPAAAVRKFEEIRNYREDKRDRFLEDIRRRYARHREAQHAEWERSPFGVRVEPPQRKDV